MKFKELILKMMIQNLLKSMEINYANDDKNGVNYYFRKVLGENIDKPGKE